MFDKQGFQSDDDVCQKLRNTVETRRAVKDTSFKVIVDFLNSCLDEGEHRRNNDVRSLFSLEQCSFHHLGALLWYVEGDETNLRL